MKKVLTCFVIFFLFFAAPALATTRAVQFGFMLNQLVDDNGTQLSGGTVYFYAAGTSTPKNVWTDKAKTAPYTSYTLDSTGSAQLYGDGNYKVIVKDSDGNTEYTWDNVYIRAANYYLRTLTGTDSATAEDDFLLCSTNGGAVTVNMFTAADAVAPVTIMRNGSNNVVVDGYGSETINGSTTYTISADLTSVVLWSDGSNWVISETPRSFVRDNDGDTQIQVEESTDEDKIRFDIAGTEQIIIDDGKVEPTTDNDVDLGSSSKEYKNMYIDGTGTIDTLALSASAGEGVGSDFVPTTDGTYDLGNSSYEWEDLFIDGTANIDTVAIDGGTATALTITTFTLGNGAGEGVASALLPTSDDSYDLGGSSYEWKNLRVDGKAYIDELYLDPTLGIKEHFRPVDDDTVDIGSSSKEFKDIYIDGVAYTDKTDADEIEMNGWSLLDHFMFGDTSSRQTIRATRVIISDGGAADTLTVEIDESNGQGYNGANWAETGDLGGGDSDSGISLNGAQNQITIAEESLSHTTGYHDGGDGESTMTDSGRSFKPDLYVGATIQNLTDGSSCTVTANTSETISCTLSGGTDDDWDDGDHFIITSTPTFAFASTIYDANGAAAIARAQIVSGDIVLDFFAAGGDPVANDLCAALDAGSPIELILIYITDS